MVKKYLVYRKWIDKESGVAKCMMAEVSEGVSKAGNAYAFAETERGIIAEETHPIGTVLTYRMTPETPNLKITKE